MPTRDQIQQEFAKLGAHDVLRRRYLKELYDYTNNSTILYAASFNSNRLPGIPGHVLSIAQHDIQGFMSALSGIAGESLDLILHSQGGSLEAADQIVQYLRSKFGRIRAIVPQNAMSAATMIACACDEIVMGKHSAIGPIDPQITLPTPTGHFTAPAHAILSEFEQARKDIIADPRTAPLWVNKFNTYPAGLLTMCGDTIDLAKEKVAGWLERFMFKGSATAHETAKDASAWLANAAIHKTHGRPISLEQARSIGLKVVPLEEDQSFQEHVLSVFHATMLTFESSNCMKLIENHNGKGWFVNVNIQLVPSATP